jgi:heme A synthase
MLQGTARKKAIIYVLIGVGFAGLIGAHEVAPADAADADMTLPFVLAAIGTLSFVVAGMLAFRVLKRGG